MFSELLKHPRALALSVGFHLLLMVAIFFNLHLTDETVLVKQSNLAKTVKAEIVDVQQLEAQKNKKKREQEAQRKRALEKQKIEKEKKRKQAEQKKRKIAAEKKKKEDAKRAAEAKNQADLNNKKLAEELKKKQAEQLEKAQQAEKQKKLAEQKRILEEQKVRQAEQKRLEQEKLKQEAEKRRLAEEEQIRRQQELEAKLEAEESQRKLNSLLQAYLAEIAQKVHRNWIRPQESGKIPPCEVNVLQGPGGMILDVSIGACEGGSPTYRRSIESAVYKADPLPTPGDASLFDREIKFVFTPE